MQDNIVGNTDGGIKRESRTFMPEILYPGTGLSPLSDRSKMPFNNVYTLEDFLKGQKYELPGGGGNWSDGEDASTPSYKEDADTYRQRDRAVEMFNNLSNAKEVYQETWKVKTKDGYKVFPSFNSAQMYSRKMKEKGIPVSWVTRTASAKNNFLEESLLKTFMVESFDYSQNIKETGSCFCVAPNTFVTCAHVVKKYNKNTESSIDFSQYANTIKVNIINGGKGIEAKVVAYSGVWDICILYADINIDSFTINNDPKIGDKVIAIGSPHGFENNVSFGNISSFNRKIFNYKDAPTYMFVDLTIMPGNSGGPIIDERGMVVGMVTAVVGDNGGLNASIEGKYIFDFCLQSGVKIKQ